MFREVYMFILLIDYRTVRCTWSRMYVLMLSADYCTVQWLVWLYILYICVFILSVDYCTVQCMWSRTPLLVLCIWFFILFLFVSLFTCFSFGAFYCCFIWSYASDIHLLQLIFLLGVGGGRYFHSYSYYLWGGGCHSVTWMISSKVSVTTRMLLTIVAKRKHWDNKTEFSF